MVNFKHSLEGKRFGKLTVIKRTRCAKTGRTAWLCKCKCGKTKSILQHSLLAGNSRTCGCGVGKSTALRWEKKIRIGSRFGKLKVLEKKSQDKWGNWTYLCKCDCGNNCNPKGTDLRCGKTRSCGCGQIEAVTKHGLSRTIEYRRRQSVINVSRRRARKKNLGSSFSEEEVSNLFDFQEGRCYYCNEGLNDFHRDHKIPLVRGGLNTIENIALTCPSCNLKKNRKTDKEFFSFLSGQEGAMWLKERSN